MADIINVVKHGGYSMMSNFHLTDKRLSWNAKGLLSALLSLSGEYTIDELAELTFDKNADTGEGIAELERYGYLTWKQVNYKNGFTTNEPEIKYTVYERPISEKSLQSPVLELPNEEDVPSKALPSEWNEEEQIRLRDRLKLQKVAEKCSENFVEVVFRELCRRDEDFRKIMTAEAFEYVCLTVWERQRGDSVRTLSGLLNVYFDKIAAGIRSASGGSELADSQNNSVENSLANEYYKNR